MSSLRRCTSCGSFATSDRCPSCRGALLRATKLGVLATALGSGAFAMTLMACYGCPDCSVDRPAPDDSGVDASRRDAAKVTCTGDSRYTCYQCCVGAHPGDPFEQEECALDCTPEEDSGASGPRDSGAGAPGDAGADADADAG